MSNIKSSSWLASAALALIMAAPAANAAGMPASGNFVSLRINGAHAVYGMILSPTKILVPAHAVGGAVSSYSILAGSTDTVVTNCATCELRAVQTAIRHPSYNSNGQYVNDVAVLHIPALTFNSKIFASTIAASFSTAIGTQFTQIGYGTGGTNHNRVQTTATTPWTVATMAGYTYTPGSFLTATTDTTINGMISYTNVPQSQVYTKLSDYRTWIDAN